MSPEKYLLAADQVALNLRSGRQAQHRVPMNPQPVWLPDIACWMWRRGSKSNVLFHDTAPESMAELRDHAPWQPGNALYVRECWAVGDQWNAAAPRDIVGVLGSAREKCRVWYRADAPDECWRGRWRPSILMPKWAARTWLKVTRFWAEESSEWTEEVARAEGFESLARFEDFMRSAYGPELLRWWWAGELELDRERSGLTA